MTDSKRKGTAAETAVVRYLRSFSEFPNAERRALSGGKDKGDVTGIPGAVIEVKAAERLELAKWQRETLTEMANAEASWGLLVVKRKFKPVYQWDAYGPARQFVPTVYMPKGEEWVRMDLVLAAGWLALRTSLSLPSSSTTE